MVAALLLLVTGLCLVCVTLLLEVAFRSGGVAAGGVYRLVFWCGLPALSILCLVLGLSRASHPPDWLLLVATLPPLVWVALSWLMCRHVAGDSLAIDAGILVWSAMALVLLVAALAVPERWDLRTFVAVWALIIPTPLMVGMLLLGVANVVAGS
jgi:hypothetical protein